MQETQTEGPLRQLVRAHRAEILELAHRHGAQDVQIIGSVARGTETPASDIDFLVTFEPGRTLFDLAALTVGLEELLDVHVDVISRGGLKQRDEATFLETTAAL